MPWNDHLAGPGLTIAETTESPLRVMAGPGPGKSIVAQRHALERLARSFYRAIAYPIVSPRPRG